LQITVNVEHLVEGSAAIEVAHHIAKSERCRVVLTAFAIELPLLDRLQGMLAVRHKDIGVAGQAEGILSE
jgi:hypothetical protein